MARANNLRDQRHARIYARWLPLPAWLGLSGEAAKLLCHLMAHYRPGRNGLDDFSVREAGNAIGKSKSCGARALLELELAGWLSVVRVGTFQARNRPSRYALTMWPNDATGEPASMAFQHLERSPRISGDARRLPSRSRD